MPDSFNLSVAASALNTAIAQAAAAAPQSTTYTKTEVDTALAAKANTSDLGAAAAKGFDATPTSGHTDYAVSSDGVYQAMVPITAELVELVDSGAKNLLNPDYCTYSSSEGVNYSINSNEITVEAGSASNARFLLINVPNLPLNTVLVLSGCPANGGGESYMMDVLHSGTKISGSTDTGNGSSGFTLISNDNNIIRIRIAANYALPSTVFKVMLCTEAAWDVSQKFVPYAPTNRELYEMILALQNAQNGG